MAAICSFRAQYYHLLQMTVGGGAEKRIIEEMGFRSETDAIADEKVNQ